MTAAAKILKAIDEVQVPAGSASLATLLRLSDSQSEAVSSITEAIVRDKGLAAKVLEAANSLHFRDKVSEPVDSVTRSVVLLGLNTIKQLAIAFSLADKLFEPEQQALVHNELSSALLACSLATKLLDELDGEHDKASAEVATLMKSLGKLVAAAYAYTEFQEVNRRTSGGEDEETVALEVLGATFDKLARAAGEKLLPDACLDSASTPFATEVAQHSNRLAEALVASDYSPRDAKVLACYQDLTQSLELSRSTVEALAEGALSELEQVKAAVKEHLATNAEAEVSSKAGGSPFENKGVALAPVKVEVLLSTAATMTELAAGGSGSGPVAEKAVELLATAGEFRLVLYCEQVGLGSYKMRAVAGPDSEKVKGRVWIVDVGKGASLFDLALLKGVSLHLTNPQEQKVRDNLPPWMLVLNKKSTELLFVPFGAGRGARGFICGDSGGPGERRPILAAVLKSVRASMELAYRSEKRVA